MANQRMFIRCKSCGDEFFLAKRMMREFYTMDRSGMAQKLDAWLEKHGQWGLKCGGEDMGMDAFEISYECEPDYEGRAMKWPEHQE